MGLKVIMYDTRERPSNEGWRAMAGYKGTRDRLHECDDDSTWMLETRTTLWCCHTVKAPMEDRGNMSTRWELMTKIDTNKDK